MPLPKIELQGRVIGEPTLRFTAQGTPNLTLRVVAKKVKPTATGGFEDVAECWLDVVIWPSKYVDPEKLHEQIENKSLVFVLGELVTRSWLSKDGTKKYATEIRANTVYAVEERKDVVKEKDPWAAETIVDPIPAAPDVFEPPF